MGAPQVAAKDNAIESIGRCNRRVVTDTNVAADLCSSDSLAFIICHRVTGLWASPTSCTARLVWALSEGVSARHAGFLLCAISDLYLWGIL